MSLIKKTFQRLHYPTNIIAQCVRWYLAYSLSLRNLEEMMPERGITVDHSTLHRWVIRPVPLLDKAFRRHKRALGRRWRMDETYIRLKGQWKYLYRAVDSDGQAIDILLAAKRDAGREQDECIKVRQSKYLNNMVAQDHRNIKRRRKLMTGFKSFRRAQAIWGGYRNHPHVTKRAASAPARGRISPGRAVLSSGCIKNQQARFPATCRC